VRAADETSADSSCNLLIYNRLAPKNLKDSTLTVVIDPPESFGGVTVGAQFSSAGIVSLGDDALTRDTDLAGLSVKSARELSTRAPALATSEKGPLIIRDGKLICLGFSLRRENTDWMLRPGFPVFWAKLIEELAPQARQGFAYQLMGSGVGLHIGEANATLERLNPAGGMVLAPAPGEFRFSPEKCGVYRLADGEQTAHVAFNLLGSEESSTVGSWKTLGPDIAVTAAGPRGAPPADVRRPFTSAILLMGLVVAVAHWCLKR